MTTLNEDDALVRKQSAEPPWVTSLMSMLAAERSRWVLWFPVFLGLGIAIYFSLPTEPPAGLVIAGLVAALLLCTVVLRKPEGLMLAGMIAAVAIGVSVAQLRTIWVAAPIVEKRLGPSTVTGIVQRIERRPTRFRITLGDVGVDRLSPRKTPIAVRLTLPEKFLGEVFVGQRVRLTAILLPPPEPMTPRGYDFARQAYFQSLGAVGFALGRVSPVSGQERKIDRRNLRQLRSRIASRVNAVLPDETAAVAIALMTGERGAIDHRQLEALRHSGLAHLLAISGLHMGLVAGWLFLFARLAFCLFERVAVRYAVKKWAAVIALIGAAFYLVLTGATVPTQRAFVMAGIVLLAVILDRSAMSMRLVACAAALVLLWRPESLLSASFQLSFAAVVALIAVYEAVSPRFSVWRSRWSLWRRGGLYLASVALTTLVASAATAPYALYHFNQIASLGIAANVIAVPTMAFWVMPSGLLAMLAMPLGLEWLPLWLMGQGITVVLAVAREVAGWPHAVLRFASPEFGFLAAVTLAGLWLCLWQGRWRWFGLVGFAAAVWIAATAPKPDILVDRQAKLIAIRGDDDVLRFSTLKAQKTVRERWQRHLGQVPDSGESLHCDNIGCTGTARGRKIAIIRDGRAAAEDCRWADIVISAVPLRGRCRDPALVLDWFDIWRRGASELFVDAAAIRLLSARDARGQRPWTVIRGRSR